MSISYTFEESPAVRADINALAESIAATNSELLAAFDPFASMVEEMQVALRQLAQTASQRAFWDFREYFDAASRQIAKSGRLASITNDLAPATYDIDVVSFLDIQPVESTFVVDGVQR